jgi:hypothetical protein
VSFTLTQKLNARALCQADNNMSIECLFGNKEKKLAKITVEGERVQLAKRTIG